MKWFSLLVSLVVFVTGCRTTQEGSSALKESKSQFLSECETNQDVREQVLAAVRAKNCESAYEALENVRQGAGELAPEFEADVKKSVKM